MEEKKTNNLKLTKPLLATLIVIFIFVGIYKGYLFFIERDYWIYNQVSCDSEVENCFVAECVVDVDGSEECGKEHVSYYKGIFIKASYLDYCNFNIEECEKEPTCDNIESTDCRYVFCSDDELSEGEHCSQ